MRFEDIGENETVEEEGRIMEGNPNAEDPHAFFRTISPKGASPEHGAKFGVTELFEAPVVADLFIQNGRPETMNQEGWNDLTDRWLLGQLNPQELDIVENLFIDFIERTHTPLHNPADNAFRVRK